MRPRFAALILLLHAALFTVLGLWALIDIGSLLQATDISLPSAKARTEARTLYGGLELALGAWLLGCWRFRAVRHGLGLCLICYLGLAVARAGSMFVEQTAASPLSMLLTIELLGALLAGLGLRALATAKQVADGV